MVARLLKLRFPSPAMLCLGTLGCQVPLREFLVPGDKSIQFTLLVCDDVELRARCLQNLSENQVYHTLWILTTQLWQVIVRYMGGYQQYKKLLQKLLCSNTGWTQLALRSIGTPTQAMLKRHKTSLEQLFFITLIKAGSNIKSKD